MFSTKEKRIIAEAVQTVLRLTNNPELPQTEIDFCLHVDGSTPMSWADIRNNGVIKDG